MSDFACPTCWGTGSIESSDSTDESWWDCPRCEGTGRRRDRRHVSTIRSPLKMVRSWHEKYGQQVRDAPDPAAPDDLIELRRRLQEEELEELVEAMEARDIVGIADALADLLYVVYGTAVSYGIDLDAVFAEVHRSNMTKTHDPSRAKYAGKVVVKGDDYEPPQIARVLGLESGEAAA